MSELQQRHEIEAFFNFFSTFNLAHPVSAISDLADGTALVTAYATLYSQRRFSRRLSGYRL